MMIQIQRDGPVAVYRISRPPANALNLAIVEEALAAIERLAADPEPPALVIVGEGRFFSAGIDLKEVPSYGRAEQARMVGAINRMFHALYGYARPVVAAVNGHALGGGLIVALAADHRVCTSDPSAKLGLREVKVGVPFPTGAMEVVRDALTATAARRIALHARDFDPAGALAEGAVDELAAPERVLARALEIARDLAALPASAYAITKRDLRRFALARIAEAVQTGRDPLLASWLSEETGTAAQSILAAPRV
jgi:enoyl-CoA hydratase